MHHTALFIQVRDDIKHMDQSTSQPLGSLFAVRSCHMSKSSNSLPENQLARNKDGNPPPPPPGVKQDYNEPLAWLFPLCTFCHRYQILLQKNLYALDFHINHHRVNQSVAGMNVRAVKMPLDEGGHSWFIGSCAICAFQVDNESSSRTFMVSRVMRRRTMITF